MSIIGWFAAHPAPSDRSIGLEKQKSRSSWPLALDRLDLLMTTHVKAYRLAPGRRAPCPAPPRRSPQPVGGSAGMASAPASPAPAPPAAASAAFAGVPGAYVTAAEWLHAYGAAAGAPRAGGREVGAAGAREAVAHRSRGGQRCGAAPSLRCGGWGLSGVRARVRLCSAAGRWLGGRERGGARSGAAGRCSRPSRGGLVLVTDCGEGCGQGGRV